MWIVDTLTVAAAAFLLLFGEPIAAHIRNSRQHASSEERP